MFPVLRALRSPEVILHSLVVEARTKLHRSAPSDPIKVRLGRRHLNRLDVLSKERIEGIVDALLQIHGITDDYRPVISVWRKLCEHSGDVVLVEVSIEVPARVTV